MAGLAARIRRVSSIIRRLRARVRHARRQRRRRIRSRIRRLAARRRALLARLARAGAVVGAGAAATAALVAVSPQTGPGPSAGLGTEGVSVVENATTVTSDAAPSPTPAALPDSAGGATGVPSGQAAHGSASLATAAAPAVAAAQEGASENPGRAGVTENSVPATSGQATATWRLSSPSPASPSASDVTEELCPEAALFVDPYLDNRQGDN